MDVDPLLQSFPAILSFFPCKYLGLLLHLRTPRRVDFQPLLDKVAGRLRGWKSKMLSAAGRLTLVKFTLSSISTYHLTVFSLPKWVDKRLDKIRRAFLWNAKNDGFNCKGKALVNWRTVCRPKCLGGLGITDTERFGRALSMRWPWLEWKAPNRPWVGSKLPCDEKDLKFFRASTRVTLGNREKALFWHDSWVEGTNLKPPFPNLFKVASRKKRTVQKELHQDIWIRALAGISSFEQLFEFAYLAEIIARTQLQPQVTDDIFWKWMTNGDYTAASAYQAQFVGSYPGFDASKIWKARAEPKCKFFALTMLHGKILTADNLAAKGWDHEELCVLYNEVPETIDHLCRTCPFTRKIWDLVRLWFEDPPSRISTASSIDEWWEFDRATLNETMNRNFDDLIIYAFWSMWKERNRRIFQHQAKDEENVAFACREEFQGFRVATRPPVVVVQAVE